MKRSKPFSFFLCPHCGRENRRFSRWRWNGVTIFSCAVFSVSFVIFGMLAFSWKFIFLLPLFAGFYEVVFRMVRRPVLTCQGCGFDPFLYLDLKRRPELIEKLKSQQETMSLLLANQHLEKASISTQNKDAKS